MTLARVQNLLQYKKEALKTDAIINELYLSAEASERFGDVTVIESSDYSDLSVEEKKDVLGRGKRARNGSSIDGFESLWEYVPFNSVSILDQRAIDFNKGQKGIDGALDDDGKLNVSKIIRVCRTKVMALYKDVMKEADENLYTMTVESRLSGGLAKGSTPVRFGRLVVFILVILIRLRMIVYGTVLPKLMFIRASVLYRFHTMAQSIIGVKSS